MTKQSNNVNVPLPSLGFINTHITAFKISFLRLYKNIFKLLFFFVVTSFSAFSFILLPFALLAYEAMIHSLIRDGDVDFTYIISKLKMKWETYFGILIATSLSGVIIIAGFSLFIIPGIILTYALAPLIYVLLTNSEITGGEAVMYSINTMKGNKVKLFFHRLFSLLPVYAYLLVFLVYTFLSPIGTEGANSIGDPFDSIYLVYNVIGLIIFTLISLYFFLAYLVYVSVVNSLFCSSLFSNTLLTTHPLESSLNTETLKKWSFALLIFFIVPPLLFGGIDLVISGNSNTTSSIGGTNSITTGTRANWSINLSNSTSSASRLFRPTVSRSYEIYTTGSKDTLGSLYNNSTGALLATNDDGVDSNFYITYFLSANTTYRITVQLYSGSGSFNLIVS